MRVSLSFSLVLSLAAFGCGESHDASDDDGGIEFDAASADGGGGVDSGGGFDAGGGTDAGGEDSSLPLLDAGVGLDAGGGADASGIDAGGTTMGIDCMGSTCDSATQQCCITGGFGGTMGTCIPSGDMCMGGTADCDGPEDCGSGEICCGTGGLGGVTVACIPASDGCGGPGSFSEFELCHEASDCTDGSSMCCPLTMLGFSSGVCQPMCFGGGFP